jgi:hypothetical protein
VRCLKRLYGFSIVIGKSHDCAPGLPASVPLPPLGLPQLEELACGQREGVADRGTRQRTRSVLDVVSPSPVLEDLHGQTPMPLCQHEPAQPIAIMRDGGKCLSTQ